MSHQIIFTRILIYFCPFWYLKFSFNFYKASLLSQWQLSCHCKFDSSMSIITIEPQFFQIDCRSNCLSLSLSLSLMITMQYFFAENNFRDLWFWIFAGWLWCFWHSMSSLPYFVLFWHVWLGLLSVAACRA